VANYDVNLDVKVRAQQLKAFNKSLNNTVKDIKLSNKELKKFESGAKGIAPSLAKLNSVLTKAKANFFTAARGTDAYRTSLVQLAEAERIVRQEQSKSTFDLNQARKRANKTERDAEAARLRRLREERRLRKQINQEQAIFLAGQSQAVTTQGFLPGGNFGVAGGQIGPRQALPARLGFGAQAQGGPFAMPGGAMGRLKGGVGSALIGGGFPALFGAGGLSSVLGGVAGGVGGALAPGGGFAASIFATAIAAQITKAQEFDKALKKLNRSIAATGNQSQFTAGQITEFAKSMDMTKEEALEALKAFEQFGASARISLLKVFGDEATFSMLASLKDNAAILSQMDQITKNLGFEQAGLVLEILNTKGARAAENKILELTVKKNKELNMQIKERVGAEGRLRQIRKQQRAEEELRVQKQIEEAKTLLDLQIKRTEEERKQAIIKAPIDELQRLLDPLNQVNALAQSIGSSFQDSFRGIITGSMTAQAALRNLFMRTADHFADMAAQILANQIKAGILGLFSNFLTPSPRLPSTQQLVDKQIATHGNTVPAGSFNISPSLNRVRGTAFKQKANGGPVMKGGSYIVGERGPEMFSPGVSGMITPNHELGGTTNIVVNVDASGSSVEGNDIQANQFGNVLAAAIQAELINQKRSGGLLSNT